MYIIDSMSRIKRLNIKRLSKSKLKRTPNHQTYNRNWKVLLTLKEAVNQIRSDLRSIKSLNKSKEISRLINICMMITKSDNRRKNNLHKMSILSNNSNYSK